ncbi:hypothetical protein TFLX_04797 [Thermoflexales bacterium]|nr:hypothetical protein TFLX_04797 [Thermoflexales bacterium]
MDRNSEARIQHKLAAKPEVQHQLRRLTIRRVLIAWGLIVASTLFLLWLPPASRRSLLASLFANRLLIMLLLVFGLTVISLLWSVGQRLDVWVFTTLNLRGYHAIWLDRTMWLATQLGSAVFAALLAGVAYALGYRRFAVDMVLGSLTLWLLVTLLKVFTDRARPFNLLRETRVVGWRVPSLSFPSGHSAQTFFVITAAIGHFQLPLGAALGLYASGVLVAFTRIYLGVHYPRDVLAGAVLGLIWGIWGPLVMPYL